MLRRLREVLGKRFLLVCVFVFAFLPFVFDRFFLVPFFASLLLLGVCAVSAAAPTHSFRLRLRGGSVLVTDASLAETSTEIDIYACCAVGGCGCTGGISVVNWADESNCFWYSTLNIRSSYGVPPSGATPFSLFTASRMRAMWLPTLRSSHESDTRRQPSPMTGGYALYGYLPCTWFGRALGPNSALTDDLFVVKDMK